MPGREQFYVHEYKGRWIVAQQDGGTFTAPLPTPLCKLTGCSAIYGPLAYVAGSAYSYKRRADALRRARQIYGTECTRCGRCFIPEGTWAWNCPACAVKQKGEEKT